MDCSVLYVCRAMGFKCKYTYEYLHIPQIGHYNLDNGRVYLGETISAHIVWKRYRIVFISVYKEHLIMFYYYLKGDDSMYVLLHFLL